MLRSQTEMRFRLQISLIAVLATAAQVYAKPQLMWVDQFGGERYSFANDIAADELGQVYVTGRVSGSVFGPAAGLSDVFIKKYSESGGVIWATQFGSPAGDEGQDLALDGEGNLLLSAAFDNPGWPSPGDVVLRKYDPAANVLWSRRFGTAAHDISEGLEPDGFGNFYVAGRTTGALDGPNGGTGSVLGSNDDMFLRKYDGAGILIWGRQWGGLGSEFPGGVAVDATGSAIVAGRVTIVEEGVPAGIAVALRKFSPAGETIWERHVGSDVLDLWGGVELDDAGNIFVEGRVSTHRGGGSYDDYAALAKFDEAGSLLWNRRLGAPVKDSSVHDVAVTADGHAYIAGSTDDDLSGPNAGGVDAFVAKYSPSGTHLWTYQLGTTERDSVSAIDVDDLGNIFLTGTTLGDLGRPIQAGIEVWVAQLREIAIPEPAGTSTLLVVFAATALFRRR